MQVRSFKELACLGYQLHSLKSDIGTLPRKLHSQKLSLTGGVVGDVIWGR